MKFVFPVFIVRTRNKHFRSEKNGGKPSQEPYKQNIFFDFRYLESFWRNKRTDKHTFTLLIGDVGSEFQHYESQGLTMLEVNFNVMNIFGVPQGLTFQFNFYVIKYFRVPQDFSFQLNFYFISYVGSGFRLQPSFSA